jgi:UDP-glucuronate 4-epimerase
MRVVVTGGAGFIGSHTCERLLRSGHHVTIVDDLNDFYSPEMKCANLQAIRQTGDCEFVQVNIADSHAIFALFERCRPDAVIHLAARAGVRPSLQDPLLYEETNVRGTLVLLEASRRTGVEKFIFASSSSVYGISDRIPFREDHEPTSPISPYAATKIAGEKLCFTYSHLYGIHVTCLRLFTVYGPRQRPDLAINRFVGMIEGGEPVPVFGDGSSGRDYTYVRDIVAGITSALEYGYRYEVINLGNSHPIRLSDLIRAIEAAVGEKARVVHLPDQPGDPPITYADISKARRLLGYRPATRFDDGLANFIEWKKSGNGTRPGLQMAHTAAAGSRRAAAQEGSGT